MLREAGLRVTKFSFPAAAQRKNPGFRDLGDFRYWGLRFEIFGFWGFRVFSIGFLGI